MRRAVPVPIVRAALDEVTVSVLVVVSKTVERVGGALSSVSLSSFVFCELGFMTYRDVVVVTMGQQASDPVEEVQHVNPTGQQNRPPDSETELQQFGHRVVGVEVQSKSLASSNPRP
jgi:hypothetical protein